MFRRPHHQLMRTRFKRDYCNGGAQIAQCGHVLAVQPSRPISPPMPKASPTPPLPGQTRLLPLGHYLEIGRTSLNQAIAGPSTKATAVSEQVQGLQHASLAGPVIAYQ